MDDISRTEDDRNKYGTRSEGLVPAQNTLGGAAVSGHVTGGGGGKEGRLDGGKLAVQAGWFFIVTVLILWTQQTVVCELLEDGGGTRAIGASRARRGERRGQRVDTARVGRRVGVLVFFFVGGRSGV